MAAEVKTELNIPDLWFDFYARLVPGTCFALALYWRKYEKLPALDGWHLFGLFGAGYVLSLITQPLSSRAARMLEDQAAKIHRKDGEYVERVKTCLGESSRRTLILDKMHGEVTMYVQAAFLSVVYLLSRCLVGAESVDALAAPIAVVAIFYAAEVADRRMGRAKSWNSCGG